MYDSNGAGGLRKPPPHVFLKSNLEKIVLYKTFRETSGARLSSLIHMEGAKYKAILFPNDIENIISAQTTQLLKNAGIDIMVPASMTCQRTIIVRNIDEIEYDLPEMTILNTIQDKNHVKVEEIIKIPSRARLLKIKLASIADNDKIKNEGLILEYTKINNFYISQETPTITPRICKKCYIINEHTTQQCTNTKLICSLCATEGHRHETCTATTRRCINCNGEHCALALSCPKIKKISKELRTQTRNTPANSSSFVHSTYANATNNQQHTNTLSKQAPTTDYTLQMMQMYSNILAECKKPQPTITNLREHQAELNVIHKHLKWPLLDFPEELLAKYSPKPLLQPITPTNDEEMQIDPSSNKRGRNLTELSPEHSAKKPHQAPESLLPPVAPSTPSDRFLQPSTSSNRRATSNNRSHSQSSNSENYHQSNSQTNQAAGRHLMPALVPQYRGRSQSIKGRNRQPHPSQ